MTWIGRLPTAAFSLGTICARPSFSIESAATERQKDGRYSTFHLLDISAMEAWMPPADTDWHIPTA